MNRLAVSVIVITYNQESTIRRTIDSILQQLTSYEFEIIIGEDASTDNTRAICEKYAEDYDKIIRLLPKATNKGVVKNYFDCLKECTGKYIAQCAGDDWWHNRLKLQLQVEFLENNLDFGLVYGGANWYDVFSKSTYYIKPQRPNNSNLFDSLLLGNYITAPTVCFRRKLIDKINMDEIFTLGVGIEDYPMWLVMSTQCKFYCLEDSLVTYSINPNSLSRSENLVKQEEFEDRVLKIKLFYWVKYESQLTHERIADAHYNTLFYTFPKYKFNRNQILSFLNHVKCKTINQKILSFFISIQFIYNLYCLYYKVLLKIKRRYV